MTDFPKILFFNINFRTESSDGITISKIIEYIPKRYLALLMQNNDSCYIDIFGSIFNIYAPTDTIQNLKNRINSGILKNNLALAILKFIYTFILGKRPNNQLFILDDQLTIWLRKLNPDYLYFNPDSLESILFAKKIVKVCNCKIIVHVLDDKVSYPFSGYFGKKYTKEFALEFHKLIKCANIRLSISDKMGEVYFKRYGFVFNTFHNSIDTKIWQNYSKKNWNFKCNDTIKFLYMGNIDSNWDSLISICSAIWKMNEIGYNISFDFYTKLYEKAIIDKLLSFKFVTINGYVEQEEILVKLRQYDILILPLSFKKRMQFVNLSMPTKTSEFMISGVPICVFASQNSALYQYAETFGWAHLIGRNKISFIKTRLEEIMNSKKLRENISSKAIKIATERHDKKFNQERFALLLGKDYCRILEN